MGAIRTTFKSTAASTLLVGANRNRVGLLLQPPLINDATFSIDAGVAAVLDAGIVNWGNGINFPVELNWENVGALIEQPWFGIGATGGDTFVVVELIDDENYGC